ncbi:MAG: ABATE domain-containing protein [Acidobacteriia bacterium]|nr:ABATE domain-containing protein [Terriglobia bacterium]
MGTGNQSTDLHQLQNASGLKFIGGRLCLDFVNTVGGRVSSRAARIGLRDYADTVVRDKIAGYDDLMTWAQLAGVMTQAEARSMARRASAHRKKAASVLARAATLREALYRIFKSVVERWPPHAADVDVLRRELAVSRGHERLIPSPGGFAWNWEDRPDALDRVLWPVAKSAAELLTSRELAKVRQCGGDECGWMFLDTSRNRSRQWCDMRDCGNRSKVRRFRQRQLLGK